MELQGLLLSAQGLEDVPVVLAAPGSAGACGDEVTAEVCYLWVVLPGSLGAGEGLDSAKISAMRQLKT